MRILLPPSETKRLGGGKSSLTLESFREPLLNDARLTVLHALQKLSAHRSEAMRILKLSAKQASWLESNQELFTSPTMPAIERYTGVLYDALAPETLDVAARSWLDATVLVQSAAFGRIAASDRIPNYRLSASNALPHLKIAGRTTPLKKFWQHWHSLVDSADGGVVDHPFTLDLRSQDYVSLAPLPRDEGNAVWVNIVSRGEDGVVRALNHFNKAAKGSLVRLLALTQPQIADVAEFASWAKQRGIEISLVRDGEIEIVAESIRLEAGQPGSGKTRKSS